MASSNSEVKKPGSSGSLLAPSKFGANFGRSDPKRLFTGLKASKLTSITQSVCNSSAVAVTQQSQPTSASQAASATTAPSSKPFVDQTGQKQSSSSCTPVISKVTLNVSSTANISPQKQERAESPVEAKCDEPSGYVFGQNVADRAENFTDAQNAQTSSSANATASTSVNKVTSQSSPPGFVFGENLADRVTTNDTPGKNSSEGVGEKEKPADTPLDKEESSNIDLGTSNKDTTNLEEDATETKSSSPAKDKNNASSQRPPEQTPALTGKTLHENAAEYFETHLAPPKRKYDEVEVITGEENEHNVLHMSAKLYIFDKSKAWLERGRGELRLNDLSVAAANATSSSATCLTGSQASREVKRKVMSSRIVMRTIGSLRVILNTKVYHGMSVEKPNEKSVRLTGMDDGAVKVFLVSGSPKDADALHCALKSRLAELKSTQDEFSSLAKEENKDISEKNGDARKLINKPDIDDDGVSSNKKFKTTDV